MMNLKSHLESLPNEILTDGFTEIDDFRRTGIMPDGVLKDAIHEYARSIGQQFSVVMRIVQDEWLFEIACRWVYQS